MEATSERLKEIAANVAPLIKGRWKHDKRPGDNEYNHNRQSSTIFNADNPAMKFSITRGFAYADRFKAQVSGDFAELRRQHGGYFETSSIKFSHHREFRSIAKDINNRFLPDFIKQFEDLKARVCNDQDRVEAHKIKELMLSRLFRDTHKTSGYRSYSSGEYYASGPDLTYRLHGDDITITNLTLSLEQFIQLIYKIKEEH